ncbi:hypothetical protein Ddc_20170 [Ditylenchus destructor]|nr:hypothetical protein Ddc_20170 [Ditylenchus destructor]
MPNHSSSAFVIPLIHSLLLSAALTSPVLAASATIDGRSEVAASTSRVDGENEAVVIVPRWKVGDKAAYRLEERSTDHANPRSLKAIEARKGLIDVEVIAHAEDGGTVHRWHLNQDPTTEGAGAAVPGEDIEYEADEPMTFDVEISAAGAMVRIVDMQAIYDAGRKRFDQWIAESEVFTNDEERRIAKRNFERQVASGSIEQSMLESLRGVYLVAPGALTPGVTTRALSQVPTRSNLRLDGAVGHRIELADDGRSATVLSIQALSRDRASNLLPSVNHLLRGGVGSDIELRRKTTKVLTDTAIEVQDYTVAMDSLVELDTSRPWPRRVERRTLMAGADRGIPFYIVTVQHYHRIDEPTP